MGNYLFISDAAKEVKVESHVLRYWEEELHLPIKRNELGHRYYTEEDVERFKQIKGMKERGLQLKAIKMILKDGKLDVLETGREEKKKPEEGMTEEKATGEKQEDKGLAIDIIASRELAAREAAAGAAAVVQENREEKARRLQWLLQQLIRETLQENNGELCREIKESVSSGCRRSGRKSGIKGCRNGMKSIIKRWTSFCAKRAVKNSALERKQRKKGIRYKPRFPFSFVCGQRTLNPRLLGLLFY